MTSRKVLFFAVALVFHNQYIEGRSLRNSKEHNIKKRSSYFQWQDTCPPPDFLSFLSELGTECTNTCDSDDDCLGNLLCCDNGCKMCMEPVLPPPVIDWLGSPSSYHRGFAAGGVPESNIEIDLKEPHIQPVECTYGGKTLTRGETFLKGCHKCQCKIEGISCKVGPCNIDKNPDEEEQSGETSGEDGSHFNRVEALELAGDADDRISEYLVEPGTAKWESLTIRREEGEGQKEVRVIPSFVEQEETSGIGESIELSGEEPAGEGQDGRSVEELEHSSGEGEEIEVGLRQQQSGKQREDTRSWEETEEFREGDDLDNSGKRENKEEENRLEENIEQVGEKQEKKSRQDVQQSSIEKKHKHVHLTAKRKSRKNTRQGENSNTLPKLRILQKLPKNGKDMYNNALNI